MFSGVPLPGNKAKQSIKMSRGDNIGETEVQDANQKQVEVPGRIENGWMMDEVGFRTLLLYPSWCLL